MSFKQICMWRSGTWMLSILALILRFHASIGYAWTLNLFAAFSVVWLEREIRYYAARPAPLFENLGEASYLYLTHFISAAILLAVPGYAALNSQSAWVATMLFCSILAASFYWLVERPSHRFAQRLTRSASLASAPYSIQLASIPYPRRDPVYARLPLSPERGAEDVR